jgi:CheY-like chemotaxis protein
VWGWTELAWPVNTSAWHTGDGILHGITVLLLEDHDDTRDSLAAGLEQEGARVIKTATAQHALLEVELYRPDILVVDIELPEVDGCEFLAAVRRLPLSRGAPPPAIAVTCHNGPDDRRRTLLSGFRLHVPKPIDGMRLAQIVAGVLTHFSAES